MDRNFLVIKFHDNDHTGDFEDALRLLWSTYQTDTAEKVFKVHDKGRLKDTLITLFDHVGRAMNVIHEMRITEWQTEVGEPRSSREYISSLDFEFFENKSDFYEWKNGEWVYLDLNTGEVSAF